MWFLTRKVVLQRWWLPYFAESFLLNIDFVINTCTQVETVAQFGVIFLLFALGLEFSATKVGLTCLPYFFVLILAFSSCMLLAIDAKSSCTTFYSYELLEQLLFWEVFFRFSFSYACAA